MVLFADTYQVRDSPSDDQLSTVAQINTVENIDVSLPVHVLGWVALALDADATTVDLTLAAHDGAVQPKPTVRYDAMAGAGKAGATVFSIAGYLPPGLASSGRVSLSVTVNDATGPSPVSACALQLRYNADPVSVAASA